MTWLLITGAGGWAGIAILAAVDYTNILVAVIGAAASISNTVLIAKYQRGQRELKAIRQDAIDVKRKLGAHQRETDDYPPAV